MTSWGVSTAIIFTKGRLEDKKAQREEPDSHHIPTRSNDSTPYGIPGVNISINFERYVYLQFSHGFNVWRQDPLSEPEVKIMQLINDITDRADWQTGVNDFSVCRSWKEEALSIYFPENTELWEWSLCELRKKATDFISNERRSVFVLDSASQVCKSDRLACSELFESLRADTLDLDLSPWMYPFFFDISPIRTDGEAITLDNFLDSITIGTIRPRSIWDLERLSNGECKFYSGKSQWLATDIDFQGGDGRVTITSLINNLHPIVDRPIYAAVEHLVSESIDDWNQTLLYKALARGVSRVKPKRFKCAACSAGGVGLCSCAVEFREYSAWANRRQNNIPQSKWYENGWNAVQALDGKYISSNRIYDNVSLREGFKEHGLQIYVEIFTLEVNPDGSVSPDNMHHISWDLNGNRNERIVATTVMCLRRENINPFSGGIAFRSETKLGIWEDKPIGCQNLGPEAFASPTSAPIDSEGKRTPRFQEIGTVKLPEGRMVTYPNALQHKFEVPVLSNPSKSGSMQFMQIHLVDPHYVVASTRFVPPQSVEWWAEAINYRDICLKKKIPNEIAHMILETMFVPEKWLNTKRKRVPGLQNYWQSNYFPYDATLPCQPPIRFESALRRQRQALEKHKKVMDAVNGPKVYGRARAFRVWMRSLLKSQDTIDNSDAKDLTPILAPEEEDNVADPLGADAANNIPDMEEENYVKFHLPLQFDQSSGSEGSIEDDDPLVLNAGGQGNSIGNGGNNNGGGSGGAAGAGGTAAAGAAATQGANGTTQAANGTTQAANGTAQASDGTAQGADAAAQDMDSTAQGAASEVVDGNNTNTSDGIDEVQAESDEVVVEIDEGHGEDDEAHGEDDEAHGEDDEAYGENVESVIENHELQDDVPEVQSGHHEDEEVQQPQRARRSSPAWQTYVGAQYGFTQAELAQIQEEMAHLSDEEGLESFDDDATSQVGEMETMEP